MVRQNRTARVRGAGAVWHHRTMKTFLATAAAVAVCISPAIGASTSSGLTGTVQRACASGKLCAAGPTRATLVFTRKGQSRRGSDRGRTARTGCCSRRAPTASRPTRGSASWRRASGRSSCTFARTTSTSSTSRSRSASIRRRKNDEGRVAPPLVCAFLLLRLVLVNRPVGVDDAGSVCLGVLDRRATKVAPTERTRRAVRVHRRRVSRAHRRRRVPAVR